MVIIALNIIFYLGLCILSYKLIADVFKNKKIGFLTSVFIITAYPILRYGLTQVQDMGGFFWFLLTVYLVWRWYRDKKDWRLWVSGLAVGLGMLTKESGAMGAIFFAVILLFADLKLKNKAIDFVKFSAIPFIILIINQAVGLTIHYNSGQWFIDNWNRYAADNYQFYKWFFINASTFNALWPFILLGVFLMLKNRSKIDKDIKLYFLAVFVPSLSYFGWPLFLSRTVFISAWLLVPLSAYSLVYLGEKYKFKKLICSIIIICAIIPYILQGTLKYNHMFIIMKDCRNNIGCIWSSVKSGGNYY
ncbi:MAG: glycosyltransferase family 39 protein [bacterium]